MIKRFILKSTDLWANYYPEITGLAVGITIPAACVAFRVDITYEVIRDTSSLLAQVLSAYLGLVLTTFGVLFGLNIKSTYLKQATERGLSSEQISQVKKEIKNIYETFLLTIKLLAAGVFTSFIGYGISISNIKSEFISLESPYLYNSIFLGILVGLFTTGTINIITTVKTILTLAD